MSAVYSDADLLASAREFAFSGLMNVTAMSDESQELRESLRGHFIAIMEIFRTVDGR
jgi:hypothetical protein